MFPDIMYKCFSDGNLYNIDLINSDVLDLIDYSIHYHNSTSC